MQLCMPQNAECQQWRQECTYLRDGTPAITWPFLGNLRRQSVYLPTKCNRHERKLLHSYEGRCILALQVRMWICGSVRNVTSCNSQARYGCKKRNTHVHLYGSINKIQSSAKRTCQSCKRIALDCQGSGGSGPRKNWSVISAWSGGKPELGLCEGSAGCHAPAASLRLATPSRTGCGMFQNWHGVSGTSRLTLSSAPSAAISSAPAAL